MKTKIKTTWQKVKLGNIADLNMGQSPKSEFYNDLGEGLPFFQGVKDFGERKPTETMYCSKPAKIVQIGDVLISVRAPVGDINIAEKESCIGRGVAGIRAKDKNNEFIYYLLLNFKDYIRSYSGGTTYESINKDALRDLQFLVPENSVIRKQIADVLSAYDDLIENNTKRIKILEQIAQAIYKEWFVYFRFPGHENAKMIDNKTEFGKIPERWEVEKLGDKINILRGKNITKNTIAPGKVPFVAGGMGPAYFHNKANVEGPAITVSASGANSGYVNLYHEDIWASDCSYINKNSTPFVYYYFLLLKNRQAEITGLQRGSAQPHVYPKDLARLLIVDPPEELVHSFEEKAESTFGMINNFQLQNQNLRQARDLLLPKLVTGKIEVKI